MSDWDGESSDESSAPPTATHAPAPPVVVVKKSKWEGEDAEEEDVASDWEQSSDEEEEKPKVVSTAAAPKKKGTLKAKLAEKEAEKAARIAAGETDDVYDEDDVLDPREKARRDKERELNSDLTNAADLFGAAALGGTSDKVLDAIVSANPRTKQDFEDLSKQIIDYIVKRHQSKPLYAAFVEHHARELAAPLKDIEVRKVASGLTTLANEKQKESRDKTGGKKKLKAAAKPALGSSKAMNRLDTSVYEESLDDFGNDPTDFM